MVHLNRKTEKKDNLNFESCISNSISDMILGSGIVKSLSPQVDRMLHRYTNVTEKDRCYDFLRKFAKIRAYAAIRGSIADSAIYIRQIKKESVKQGITIDEMFERIFSKYSEIGIHPLEAELSGLRGSSSVKYFARMIIDNAVFSNLIDFKARLLHMIDDVKEGSTFVDVGCGPGEYISEILAKKIRGLVVVGVDINRAAIQIARKRVSKHNNVSYILADAHHLPFRNGLIDYSLCVWTIDFLESPKKCVREMYRILRKGGKAVLTIPHIYKYMDVPIGYSEQAKCIDKPKYRNLSKGIKNVGLKAGFSIEDIAKWTYEQATSFTWVYKQMDEFLIKFAK